MANQTPQPKDVAGFEACSAIARMMDSEGLWWRVLAIFHDHYEHWEETWRAAQKQPEVERKCLHALRSSAANVGAEKLATVAAALEDSLLHNTQSAQDLEKLRAQVLACFLETRLASRAALDLYNETKSL